jgi:hypothetical protein
VTIFGVCEFPSVFDALTGEENVNPLSVERL